MRREKLFFEYGDEVETRRMPHFGSSDSSDASLGWHAESMAKSGKKEDDLDFKFNVLEAKPGLHPPEWVRGTARSSGSSVDSNSPSSSGFEVSAAAASQCVPPGKPVSGDDAQQGDEARLSARSSTGASSTGRINVDEVQRGLLLNKSRLAASEFRKLIQVHDATVDKLSEVRAQLQHSQNDVMDRTHQLECSRQALDQAISRMQEKEAAWRREKEDIQNELSLTELRLHDSEHQLTAARRLVQEKEEARLVLQREVDAAVSCVNGRVATM